MRSKHLVTPPQPRLDPAPWLLNDDDQDAHEPQEDFDVPMGGDTHVEDRVGPEWEYHALLCGTFLLLSSRTKSSLFFFC